MNRLALFQQIKKKKSYLCVGLDTDIDKIPSHLLASDDPVFEFNKAIIEATKDYCVAYKPNLAFYEALGIKGWESLKKTIEYIPNDCLIIADAKRGDIGNTSALYAKAFFNELKADAVTVAPYMGKDSVIPFLNFENKWVIVLALTSNEGANDFQTSTMVESNTPLYENVMRSVQSWGNEEQIMFVVGATRAEQFAHVRSIAPAYFFLVPGVGAQGGDLKAISKAGFNDQCGLLVNSSRQIIYASNDLDFADKAGVEAKKVQYEMELLLAEAGLI
ncbi:MAG: orotidine-5'-phosphate decarboxylase [Bacteroidota bacterium]